MRNWQKGQPRNYAALLAEKLRNLTILTYPIDTKYNQPPASQS